MSDGFFPNYDSENEKIDNEFEQSSDFPFSVDKSDDWSLEESSDSSNDNSVNKKNEEEFQEIMENASRKYDNYWDRDNIVVKIILYVSFGIAGVGSLFYIFWWIFSN